MLFNSTQFLIFFPVVAVLYFVLPDKYKNAWLLVTSYYFYMSWNPIFILLIIYATLVSYVAALGMGYASGRLRKWFLVTGMVLDFVILFWFKYFEFFVSGINAVFERFGLRLIQDSFDIMLPVGISFFTFQTVSYMVDVYRGDVSVEKNLAKYALFVSFFPQLVAGPIERSKDFLRQFDEKHEFDYDKVRNGLLLMLWGFFLKLVIADRVALYVDTVYGELDKYPGIYVCIAVIFFSFQIYCDFAGYSTIALGVATILGFQLTDNFAAPFLSLNYSELWRRWHISLSNWFRDYMYFPLGGSYRGKLIKYRNFLTVNLVSGLWHGADWSFVVWGLWNAIVRIVEDGCMEIVKRVARGNGATWHFNKFKMLRRCLTFCIFACIFVYFRASSIGVAHEALRSMMTTCNWHVLLDGTLFEAGLTKANFVVAIVAIIILMVADSCKYKGIILREKILSFPMLLRWAICFAGLFGIIIFGVYGNGNSSFIYFAF